MQERTAQPMGQGSWLVEDGDTLVSIAERTGHYWLTLWDHPDNAELKEVRRKPNVLLPGDRVTIPLLQQRVETCSTGRVHRFRRKGVPVRVAFKVIAQSGEAFSGKHYTLTVGESSCSGTTGPEGELEHFVRPTAKIGRLKVWLETPGYPEVLEWTLKIGSLGPIDSIHGLQARLKALSYDVGHIDGTLGERTRGAIAAFQRDQKLEPTGEPDATTLERLEQAYGY